MGRTTAVKIAAIAATTAALILFGPSMAQADPPAPPAPAAVTVTPTPTPTAEGNNPWG